ncbi:hypothetical protein Tco_0422866 [Tanacetum coccineum]
MYTFSPMMVANSRKHHCRVRPYTREVLVISTNLDKQKNHYPLDFRNRRGDEARIKNTWYNQGFEESPKTLTFHDDPLNEDSTSHGSSSNVRQIHTLLEHLGRWTKDHPIENVIRDPSHSVSTRKQLKTDVMWCYYDA